MKHIYTIAGMTCNGCVSSVTKQLLQVDGVKEVKIDLALSEAELSLEKPISIKTLQDSLTSKYTLLEKSLKRNKININEGVEQSKIQQLKPLLLIFLYLFVAVFLLNYKEWSLESAMLDFMGMFYIVFSFFKLLDLRGFPESFKMYDPLAKFIPAYGWLYPFIELTLGLFFLLRFQVLLASVITVIILGITTIGVVKTLLDKKSIKCACLGTALKLPMTEATLIENIIMLLMAVTLLIKNMPYLNFN